MPGPFDYTLKGPMPDLAGSLLAGGRVAGGLLDARIGAQDAAIRQAENDRAAQADQMKMAAVAQAQQAAAAQAQAAAEARAKWAALGPDATHRQMAELIQQNPQALSLPGFKEAFDAQSEAAKQQTISDLSIPLALLSNGQKDMAIEALDKQWAAYENSNDSGSARSRQRLGELIKQDPEAARRTIFQMLNPVMTKDQREGLFALDTSDAKIRKDKADAKIAEAQAETALDDALLGLGIKRADIANTWSQIKDRNKRFDLDEKKTNADIAEAVRKAAAAGIELSEKQQGAYVDAIATSSAKTQMADMAKHAGDVFESQTGGIVNALASPLQQGVGARLVEAGANALGVTRDVDEANKEFLKIVDAEALAARPPGSGVYAKDDRAADREKALSTYATPAAKAKYMRDYEARTRTAAQVEAAKAEYLAANDGLGPAKKDITVAGKVVPKGATFQALASALTIKPAEKPASKGAPPASRIAELKASGVTKEQAMATLAAEGYAVGGSGG